MAVGKPKARVPYSSISALNVRGFPADLRFGPPSSFSEQSLKCILNNADDIEFIGMFGNKCSDHLCKHVPFLRDV